VDFIPWGVVINPDVFQGFILTPSLFNRDREGEHSVGAHDPASVSIGLFGIIVELLKEDLLLPDQPGIIIDRSVIKCRIDQ